MSSGKISFEILPADTDMGSQMVDMCDKMEMKEKMVVENTRDSMNIIKDSPTNPSELCTVGKKVDTPAMDNKINEEKDNEDDLKKRSENKFENNLEKNLDKNLQENKRQDVQESMEPAQNIMQQDADMNDMPFTQMIPSQIKEDLPMYNGEQNNRVAEMDFEQVQDYTQSYSTQPFFGNQFSSETQMVENYDQSQNFCNMYVNDGINIIDPSSYSPMVYVVEGNKMIYSNSYPFVYDPTSKVKKNSSLPYAYISRNSFVKPDFNIVQNKLKLYNYWIETTNPKHIESQIIEMFGSENIYVTKSLFFRKKSSYMGEKVILISKLPQKPFKFINRINRTFTKERRTIKSVLGDYIISPDCLFIILAERSIDYICNNYYRYHKNERLKIETLIKSFKQKFTCMNENDID